ncbi:MAG: hypothetical protein JXD18_01205 [Anaerolineae bacterium]|nr:hypothetical protein [Anaerolineae bacterium]
MLVAHAPGYLSEPELDEIVGNLQKKVERRQKRNEIDDAVLEQAAKRLNKGYFDGELEWTSIRWVTNQTKRSGRCTPSRGTIRISHRVAPMPCFVRDDVMAVELERLGDEDKT